jgi:DNA modification methylase
MIHNTATTTNTIVDNNDFNQIIPGDALTELKKLPDSFIDVCVTSPPYWNQRWYGDDTNIIGNESTVSVC